MTRDYLVENHIRIFALELLETVDELILTADGTYIYIQKIANYKFQRQSYSMHKHRPLLKPMILVTSTGYIVDVFGPYLADGNNNDANILNNLLVMNQYNNKIDHHFE